ncbi:MAG: DUF3251 domain-containing protein [Candidatus Heimdallarchaeaceae archaeon]
MTQFKIDVCAIVISVLLLSGCTEDRINKLEQEVSQLQRQIQELQFKVLSVEYSQDRYNTVVLDPSSPKGYQRINTSSGFFLISLMSMESYLDGYKLILHIGNPSTATYKGFNLKVKWGKRFEYKEFLSDFSAYNKWKETLQEKKVEYTDDLNPASWNKIEFIISPAKPEQLGYIELSMETNIVSLYNLDK